MIFLVFTVSWNPPPPAPHGIQSHGMQHIFYDDYDVENDVEQSIDLAMENGPFIDGLHIKNGDFPWRTVK